MTFVRSLAEINDTTPQWAQGISVQGSTGVALLRFTRYAMVLASLSLA